MNSKFRVLWFEDNSGWYRGAKGKVEKSIEQHCLVPEITRMRKSQYELDELKSNSYDLILMDYDLNSDKNGDAIIKEIRDADIYTDILFYSSKYDSLLKSVQEITPPIDGVFYASRKIEEFNGKMDKIIKKIVCRSEDLINLRGFVLENASDFEVRIKEILKICWDKFKGKQRELLDTKMIDVLGQKKDRVVASVDHFCGESNLFLATNEDEHCLGVADRLDILNVILQILKQDYSLPSNLVEENFKDYYIESVGMYRNRLGHVKLGDSIIRLKGKDIPIDQALHRLLRENIAHCEQSLTLIEEFITLSV